MLVFTEQMVSQTKLLQQCWPVTFLKWYEILSGNFIVAAVRVSRKMEHTLNTCYTRSYLTSIFQSDLLYFCMLFSFRNNMLFSFINICSVLCLFYVDNSGNENFWNTWYIEIYDNLNASYLCFNLILHCCRGTHIEHFIERGKFWRWLIKSSVLVHCHWMCIPVFCL